MGGISSCSHKSLEIFVFLFTSKFEDFMILVSLFIVEPSTSLDLFDEHDGWELSVKQITYFQNINLEF